MLQRHRAPSVRALLTAIVAGLLAPVLAAPAAHASATSVSMDSGVLYDRCHRYDYRYAVDTSEHTSWEATAVFRGPDGKRAGVDHLRSSSDDASGTSTKLLCGGIHRAGRYELTLEVTYLDDALDEVGNDEAVDRFRLRKPRTRTSFTVDDRTPRYHQVLTFQVSSRIEAPRGWIPNRYEHVALEARRPRGWTRIPGSKKRVNVRGVTKMKGRWERRTPLAIRAVTLPDKAYRGSASRARTLG